MYFSAALGYLVRGRSNSESSSSSSSDDEWNTILENYDCEKRKLRPRIIDYDNVINRYSDDEFKSHFRITIALVADAVQIGPPLFLTNLINRNKTTEARNASIVNAENFLNITSYSGFLTVDEKYDSNLFFWYFPVSNKPNKETPWIIWLQGGPGATSLAGLFDEMGPFEYRAELKKRVNSWTDEFSMVFIDNPVGSGFSFTNYDQGYPRNMDMYTQNLYTAVEQLTRLYPELRVAPLYVAGESYAGRYVPALARRIMDDRETTGHINLQGIILGNPVLDRESLVDYTRAFYSWGLVDEQGALAARPLQKQFQDAVLSGNVLEAYRLRNELLDKLQDIAHQTTLYNVLKPTEGLQDFVPFITSPKIRNLIHVGDLSFDFSSDDVHNHLKSDFMAAVSNKVVSLLEHYRVLIYCGQLDLVTPCAQNGEARRKKWQWSGKELFLSSPRTPWWFKDSVAGFVKSGGNFTEVLVIGAGHLVPKEKPVVAKALISSFIQGIDLPKPPLYKPNPEDTPSYQEYFDLKSEDVSHSTGFRNGLIASLVINVFLLVGIIYGVIMFLKWKRETDYFYSPLNDGILTMT